MIPLTHPDVQSFLAHGRQDPAAASILADWLQEQTPPGGLPELCWWLSRCQDEDVRGLQAALAAWDRAHGNAERAGQVGKDRWRQKDAKRHLHHMRQDDPLARSDSHLRHVIVSTLRAICHGKASKEPWFQDGEKAIELARRDLRRRLLALYPEVECVIEAEVEALSVTRTTPQVCIKISTDDLHQAGFLVHLHGKTFDITPVSGEGKRCRVRQTLRASELIPPEPAAGESFEDLDELQHTLQQPAQHPMCSCTPELQAAVSSAAQEIVDQVAAENGLSGVTVHIDPPKYGPSPLREAYRTFRTWFDMEALRRRP